MEFPTISYEEALEKELAYKKRLKMIHLQGSYQTTLMHNSQEPTPLRSITNPISETQIQINTNFRTQIQTQTISHPSITQRRVDRLRRRHVSPRHSLTPYTQMQVSRPVQPLSYWCKLCKIDCTTEHNFQAHIRGKKHQANKLAILQGHKRTAGSGTGESSGNQNTRNQNENEKQNWNNESIDSEVAIKDVESSIDSEGVIDLTNDE